MATMTAKVVLPDGTIRRVAVARDASVDELKRVARGLLGVAGDVDVVVACKDEEGDDIAVVTDEEVREFVGAAEKAGKAPKFFVRVRAAEGGEAQPQPPQQQQAKQDSQQDDVDDEPQEDAITQVARALSNPSTVHAVQAQLASSPVLTNAVADVSRAFVEGGGLRAMSAAAEAVPALRQIAVDAANVDPVLANAVQVLLRDVPTEGGGASPAFPFAAAWMPFLGAAFASTNAGAPHQDQQQQPHEPPPRVMGVHPFVVCDGCDTTPARLAASRVAGTSSPRGWIAGTRYASTSVRNFDLCETCFASNDFAASHGPFVAMEPKAPAWGPGGRCGPGHGRRAWHGHHHHGPHGHPGHGPHGHPGHGPHGHPGHGPHGHPGHGPHGHHHHHGCHGGFGEGWAAQAQAQAQHPHPMHASSQRGCRGSGRMGVFNAVNEVIGRCAAAVATAAEEAEHDDVAQIARAISESLKTHAEEAKTPSTAKPPVPVVAKPVETATNATTTTTAPTNVVGVRKVVPEPALAAATATTTTTASSSDEEWVVEDVKTAAAPSTSTSTDPMDKWRDALQRLHAIGFTDAAEYIPLLEEEKGDLERVINRVVRRNA